MIGITESPDWVTAALERPAPEDPRSVPTHLTQESQEFQEPQELHDSQDSHDLHDSQSNPPLGGEAGSSEAGQRPGKAAVEWVRNAVAEAHKLAEGRKSTPIFEFVRMVKGHPEAAGVGASAAFKSMSNLLAQFSKTTEPWVEHFGVVAPEIEFLYAWKRVRAPAGTSPLEEAVKCARQNPAAMATRGCGSPLYNLFLNVIARIRDQKPGRTIPISTDAFGKALGVSRDTVARMCSIARDEGFLVLVKKHSFRSAGGSRCAEYRFLHDAPDVGGQP